MLAEAPVKRTGQPGDAGLLLLTFALVVSDTMTRSYFSIIFLGDAAFGTFLMINFAIILIFAGVALLGRDLFILAIFLAIAAFFLGYYLYFILGAHRPVNFNSLGTYYGMLTVIVFYELAKRGLLRAVIKMIFFVYVAYLIAYSVLSLAIQFGVDVPLTSEKVTVDISDPDRADRLFMFLCASGYVAAYSVSKLKEKFRVLYLATFALAGLAAYLSMFRLLLVCSLVVFTLYVATGQMRLVQRVSFVVYLLMSAYLAFGVLDLDFNPYWFGSSDMSTLARKYQFDIVVDYIREFPIFGIGLPDATEGLIYYLGKEVYPSDLGIVGIWFQFGLVGVVILGGWVIYISCLHDTEGSSAFLGPVDARTLSLTGCIIALSLSNDVFIGSALLFSLIFASMLYGAQISAEKGRLSPRRLKTSMLSRARTIP
jgi:hypothetical protein